MIKEHFKGMLHTVAVFGNSAFSSESDAPIIEGKDGKYTIHHVLSVKKRSRLWMTTALNISLKLM